MSNGWKTNPKHSLTPTIGLVECELGLGLSIKNKEIDKKRRIKVDKIKYNI